ncbi:MAG: type 4a pilus biogenesis protein PilO [Candidatus Omnitrophica bacterium]|nr:type 4a pilus biogenesis protein PilO [Candidatus Omnitrophota bacterium]
MNFSKEGFLVLFLVLGITGWGGMKIYQYQTEKTAMLNAEQIKQEELNQVLRSIKSMQAKLDSWTQRLAPDTDYGWFLNEITLAQQSSQVWIDSLEPQNLRAEGNYVRMAVKIELEGTYHQIGEFFYALESSDKFMRIESVEFGEKTASASALLEEPRVRAKLRVSSLYPTTIGAG